MIISHFQSVYDTDNQFEFLSCVKYDSDTIFILHYIPCIDTMGYTSVKTKDGYLYDTVFGLGHKADISMILLDTENKNRDSLFSIYIGEISSFSDHDSIKQASKPYYDFI